jgi:magnesium transporter
VTIFLGDNVVITFQERPGGDSFNSVRERIFRAWGPMRSQKADYLFYALVDAVIDGYFPAVEHLGDQLEKLEDDILLRLDRETPARVHEVKRDVLLVRRAIWPLREAINSLCRDESTLITPQTRLYLRDSYDHALRLMDLVEVYREIGSDLKDLYLTSVSNRMNEIMKVLTIITTLFIPPTLIAGIYGMNFNTQRSPFNMPELNWHYGYPIALLAMVVVSLLLAWYLQRRGFIGIGTTGDGTSRPHTDS